MPRRLARGLLTGLKVVGLALLGALVLLLGLIQASNWINWWHARALLRDVQALPAQPMWLDAQRLMKRWGKWGHYEGACTSEHCQYTIQVADVVSRQFGQPSEPWYSFLASNVSAAAERQFGFRMAGIAFLMHVRNGRVVSDSLIATEMHREAGDGQGLLVSSSMRYRLTDVPERDDEDWEDAGGLPNEVGTLADAVAHPDYLVGRAICSGCTFDQVAFTPFASLDLRDRYRHFDLSCFALWGHACRRPSDLMPALREFDETTDREWARENAVYRDTGRVTVEPPPPCLVSERIVGRDSNYVLAVDPVRTEQKRDELTSQLVTWTWVRVREVLKRPTEQRQGFIQPKPGDELEVAGEALPFGSGLLLPTGGEITMVADGFELSQCKPLLDTPAAREQVKQGIAQDIPAQDASTKK